ncbi:hypothetical protein [Micrococcus luteus]|uniref:hypothetical protein n=1 Tax=Micrococcus luteus TaxID=1270 RepID=UPI0023040995|nr:hypothetical protein [Micrococcus luteus]
MAVGSAGQPTPAELVNRVRSSYGLTWDELGAAMGRSGRMMRKIARGETSGESYRQALTELNASGRLEHQPPRRRGKDGTLVKVRAKRGAPRSSVAPREGGPAPSSVHGEDRAPTRPPRSPRRTFKSETTHLPDGNRIHRVEMPKTQGTKGREQAAEDLRSKIANIARGTKHKDKRMRMEATVDIGGGRTRNVTIGSKGGYLANDVVSDVRDRAGGNMMTWMNSQMGQSYVEQMGGNSRIVSVTVTTFNADRPKAERVAQDQAGTRRWNRSWSGSRWK